jgi:RNA polymerase sigma factor (sigma-70 family)
VDYQLIRHHRRIQAEPYLDTIGDTSTCLETWMNCAEQHDQLARALERLPDGPRGALTLRLEGKSYAEIAEILGISERNVSVRLVRARQRIAHELREA